MHTREDVKMEKAFKRYMSQFMGMSQSEIELALTT